MPEGSEKPNSNPVDKLTPQQIEDILGLLNKVEKSKGIHTQRAKDPKPEAQERFKGNVQKEFGDGSIMNVIATLRDEAKVKISSSRTRKQFKEMLIDVLQDDPSGRKWICLVTEGENKGRVCYSETSNYQDGSSLAYNTFLEDFGFYLQKVTTDRAGNKKAELIAELTKDNSDSRTSRDYQEFSWAKNRIQEYLSMRN